MEIMILSADTPEAARAQIEAGLNKIASIIGPPVFDSHGRPRAPPIDSSKPKHGGFAVVIDGETLRHALAPDLKPLFLSLGTQCDTVVCCRVSPAQKAMTVKLVRASLVVVPAMFSLTLVISLLLGQGRPQRVDSIHWRWCQRRSDDTGSQHWMWPLWFGRFTGRYVSRLCVRAVQVLD